MAALGRAARDDVRVHRGRVLPRARSRARRPRSFPDALQARAMGAGRRPVIEGSYLGKVTQLRRSLHAAPELAYHEHETAKRVRSWLSACDLKVFSGIGGTGVVGVLRRGS